MIERKLWVRHRQTRFRGLLPDRPRDFGRDKALDRAVRTDYRLRVLKIILRRHDDLEALCFAIGWIAQNWAMIEQNFEMCIALIYHDLNGKKIVSKTLPLPWNQKVAFLNKAFDRIPELSKYAIEGKDLVARADQLASGRNDLVHGVIGSIHPINKRWPFKIFDYDRSDKTTHWHVLREFTFSPEAFSKIEGKYVRLAGEVARFGRRLLDDLGP